MLKAHQLDAGSTYDDRKKSYQSLHASATLVDLQAHPSLKASWFPHQLTDAHYKPSLLQRLLHVNPLAFDPLSVRTSFPKLIDGKVNVQVSTVYALEEDAVKRDLVTELQILGIPISMSFYTIVSALRWLPYLKRAWRNAIAPDYFNSCLIALDIIEAQADQYMKADASAPGLGIAKTNTQLRTMLARKDIALVHALEGAHCLEGHKTRAIQAKVRDPRQRSAGDNAIVREEVMGNLQTFYERGVAIMGLAHYYPNEVTESVFSYPERALEKISHKRWQEIWPDHTRGLTDIGKEVVDWMIGEGMIVDLSHVSPTARMEIYRMVDSRHGGKPGAVLASHIGLQAMYNHPYNLADWEIKWLSDHEGVAGVMFSNYWHTGREGVKLGLGYLTDAIDHLIEVGGERVVAFGSDFDGFSDPPDEIADASQWVKLTRHLFSQYRVRENKEDTSGEDEPEIVRKYDDETIQQFLGGNAVHTILRGWGR